MLQPRKWFHETLLERLAVANRLFHHCLVEVDITHKVTCQWVEGIPYLWIRWLGVAIRDHVLMVYQHRCAVSCRMEPLIETALIARFIPALCVT